MGEKSLLSSTSPGLSVVELTGQDNLGVRKAETRGWRRSRRGHLQGNAPRQLEESCPVLGGLSQSLRICGVRRREDTGSGHQWNLLRALGEQSDS